MTKMNEYEPTFYDEYISSDAWRWKRKQRLSIDNYTCQLCGSMENLVIHHRTYDRLGNEDVENDLITVCNKCHEWWHSMVTGTTQANIEKQIKKTLRYKERELRLNAFFNVMGKHDIVNNGKINLTDQQTINRCLMMLYPKDGQVSNVSYIAGGFKREIIHILHINGYTDWEIEHWFNISKKQIQTYYMHGGYNPMKKLNLTNVQEAGNGGENRLPAGGYVCGIVMAEDVPEKEYLRISYDIAEGDMKMYYADRQKAHPDWNWGGTLYRSYKEKALPMFKRFCSAVTKSNATYIFDGDTNSDERTLVGKLIGLVLGEEEYLGNDGTIRTRLYVVREVPAEDIRRGDFKVPELKKLEHASSAQTRGREYINVPLNQDKAKTFTTATEPAELPFW